MASEDSCCDRRRQEIADYLRECVEAAQAKLSAAVTDSDKAVALGRLTAAVNNLTAFTLTE